MNRLLTAATVAFVSLFALGAHAAEQVDEKAIATPDQALAALIAGNERFVSGKTLSQDYLAQVDQTSAGQQPYATILSCLDSRVPPEIVFDQGIGDIFVGRVAGNVENVHMLGSFEFASAVVGTKLLVVMGHTSCGAVKGACADAQLGNLTALLADIKPSVEAIRASHEPNQNLCEAPHVDHIAEDNVRRTIADIRAQSPVLAGLEQEGKLKIVGAMYDISNGRVTFM
jgi:carbonic anhydrase